MEYLSNDHKELLEALSISSVDVLFSAIPNELKLAPPIVGDGLSEYEVIRYFENIGKKNRFLDYDNYLGAGAYEHHVPAVVQNICTKSEFLTSYTPYQAEISQGVLQALFEFQTVVATLTGLEVACSTLYDGASACAESCLMALRIHPDRKKIVVSKNIHPHYLAVIKLYLQGHDVELTSDTTVDEKVAAVLIQSPNFYGALEEFPKGEKKGALFIQCGNPLSYALFKSPGERGADIAVGELQPLGMSLQFGGPYAGYMSCKKEFVRQMPGRLVGETVDTKGRRGFVLTLQTREQFIRREKATSNICTSQTNCAIAALVTALWYGKEGLYNLALTNFQKASYLKKGLGVVTKETTFNEFAVTFPHDAKKVVAHFLKAGIVPGLVIGPKTLLVAVTETKSKEQLDRYLEVARAL